MCPSKRRIRWRLQGYVDHVVTGAFERVRAAQQFHHMKRGDFRNPWGERPGGHRFLLTLSDKRQCFIMFASDWLEDAYRWR